MLGGRRGEGRNVTSLVNPSATLIQAHRWLVAVTRRYLLDDD